MAEPQACDDTPRMAQLCLPRTAGEPCGDAAAVFVLDEAAPGALLVLVDGLGHGPLAAHAAERVLATAAAGRWQPVGQLMAGLDEALRDTRGAAVGLVRVHASQRGGALDFAGVGNTRTLRWRGGLPQRLAPQYGVVGGGLPRPVAVQTLDLAPGDWLLMFSDGLDERPELPVPLPEWRREPALLCAHLARHWRQGADDVGVLAWHWPAPAAAGAV